MSRRTFIEGALAASGAQLMSGCDSKKCVTADRVGVCSWSFRLPMDSVAAEMKKLGLKRIHLALQPFLEGESRHGAAEAAAALESVQGRSATGAWVRAGTLIGFPEED